MARCQLLTRLQQAPVLIATLTRRPRNSSCPGLLLSLAVL
jgi:hypothetical protein